MITENELLRYIGKQPRHMAGFKQIVHDLGLKGRQRRDLEELLRGLTRHRKLVAIGQERWSLPTAASRENLIAGRLRMHRDGYGFVTPDQNSLPPRVQANLAGDIFIPPPAVGSAMHGDHVLVELGPIRQDGRAEGRILRVTERQQETVVAKFHYGSRDNYARPMDEKLATDIIIPPGMERPRRESEAMSETPQSQVSSPRPPQSSKARRQSPHRVLGEEVKRHASDDLEGMVVEVSIIQWPS